MIRIVDKKHLNTLFFCLIFTVVFSSLKLSTSSGSSGNIEQWLNMTNQIFYGDNDFIFSYGPLFWLAGGITTPYNLWVYWLTVLFISFLTAYFWSVVFVLSYDGRGHIHFAIAYFLFFGSLVFQQSLFLWPFVTIAYFEFAEDSPVAISLKTLFVLGILIGFSFYIRFFHGVVGLATFLSYFMSKLLLERKIKDILIFSLSFIVGYVLLGIIIFNDKFNIVNYIITNKQLSFGNSVDMPLDVTNYKIHFIIIIVVFIIFNLYFFIKRPVLLLTINALMLIFFKIGFSRSDHYISYYVIPMAIMSLVMVFEKNILGKYIFLIVIACLFYISTNNAYYGSLTKNSFDTNINTNINFNLDYLDRMKQVYEKFAIDNEMARIIGKSTIDVYPYNNEYIYANKLNYLHRPIFQNYMTITPELDSMNKKFFESAGRPKFVLWTAGISCSSHDCNPFSDFDQKYLLNVDPLTTSSILLNYHVVASGKGINGVPIILLEENKEYTSYSKSPISEQSMHFGEWYNVPQVQNGVVKIIPDFEFTIYGHLKNLFFRGSILKVKYRLFSGEEVEYRLNILNSKSGVWVSPLLDGFDLSGDAVSAIMFETNAPNYFKPKFTTKWVRIAIPAIRSRELDMSPVLLDSPGVTREVLDICDGSIDSVNGMSLPTKIDTKGVLQVQGWHAISAKRGILAEKTFLTLTDNLGKKFYIPTKSQNREDLVEAFDTPSLSSAGFKAIVDLSTLKGVYTLGVAGTHDSVLYNCSQFRVPLEIGQ